MQNMINSDKRTEKRRLGDIGENIACDFLKNKGFKIIERNYLRKWGEIDIITRKNGVMHFIEVKSVSCALSVEALAKSENLDDVTYGTENQEGYRPEDNMHPWKLKRLARTIQTYLLEKKVDNDWQLDLITVKINEKTRKARVKIIENIVI